MFKKKKKSYQYSFPFHPLASNGIGKTYNERLLDEYAYNNFDENKTIKSFHRKFWRHSKPTKSQLRLAWEFYKPFDNIERRD